MRCYTNSYQLRKSRKRKRKGAGVFKILYYCAFFSLFIMIVFMIHSVKRFEINSEQAKIIRTEFNKAGIQGLESENASKLCRILIKQLGKPYVYGKEGPDSFDCSGLVQFTYSSIGIKLPRVASMQSKVGTQIEKGNLEFGDIVFFSGDGITLTHVGIYLGDGYFIHAPEPGKTVMLSNLNNKYYSKVYKMAVRVLNSENQLPPLSYGKPRRKRHLYFSPNDCQWIKFVLFC